MSDNPTWTATSVAKEIAGTAGPSLKASFSTAQQQPAVDEQSEAQGGETTGSGIAPEPPDPTRFAECKALAGRRNLGNILDFTL